MQNRWTSQNEKARIAESYNNLYAQFSSRQVREVGNYTIIRQIGEGSFGKVYLANHKLTHTKVVLKTGAKDDPNLVREVYYHRQFSHPHITRLYEVIVSEGLIWMVLEYCSGGELYDYVVSVGRVAIEDTRRLFSQITAAVCYAHSLNCIHRDLKLENVLLDKKQNAKLTDFGFTRECQSRSLLDTICGTTVYMAPELINKNKYDGFKVDVWSLGVILYTLLYGEMPFDADDEMRTKALIVGSEPNYKDDIPDEAVSLVMWLLEKDPKLRPSTRDILTHPFLESHGVPLLEASDSLVKALVNQKVFQSKTEKHLLKKLKSLGIDIHQLQKSVAARNCDSLAGLWELLLERQKKKEWKKYKARSRSTVMRLTESTSRRVSQLMEPISSPPISRIVSIRSSTANNNNAYSPSVYSNNATAAAATSHSNRDSLQPTADTQSQANGSIYDDPKKKPGLITKISKFFKIHHHNNNNSKGSGDPFDSRSSTNSIASRPSFSNNSMHSTHNSPSKQNGVVTNEGSAIVSTNLQSVSFNNNVLHPHEHISNKDGKSPSPNTTQQTQSQSQSQSQSQQQPSVSVATVSNNETTAKLEQPKSSAPPPLPPSSQFQQTLTIKEPGSPLRFLNNGPSTSNKSKPTSTSTTSHIPRPSSMMSQHSLVSQHTFASDLSLTSTQSESTTTTTTTSRPAYYRGISSDTTHSSKGINRRSLSLISSNSSTSSSRKGSFYESSTSGGAGTSGIGSSFKFLTSASSKNVFGRGQKYINESAVFPHLNINSQQNQNHHPTTTGINGNNQRSKGKGLLPASRYQRNNRKKSKNLIIEEEEYDDIEDDDEDEDEEELNVINNRLSDLELTDVAMNGDVEDNGDYNLSEIHGSAANTGASTTSSGIGINDSANINGNNNERAIISAAF